VDAQFGNGDFSTIPRLAKELVAQRPDVIVATGSEDFRVGRVEDGRGSLGPMAIAPFSALQRFLPEPGGQLTLGGRDREDCT
jgi:hypothetical protein